MLKLLLKPSVTMILTIAGIGCSVAGNIIDANLKDKKIAEAAAKAVEDYIKNNKKEL